MANATDQQVQSYVDQRLRVRAEQVRALVLALQDDKAAIDDVYAACSQQTPTWADDRTDGPPHLLGPGDVLAFNEFATTVVASLTGEENYATLLKACVRPVSA